MRSTTKAMNHTISIKNLGPIKEIKNFEVKNINAVIGESATGKSLLAKAIFVFNHTNFLISLFENNKKKETSHFVGFFGSYKNYSIVYNYGNNLIINVNNHDGKTNITLSDELNEAVKYEKEEADRCFESKILDKNKLKKERFIRSLIQGAFVNFEINFLTKINVLLPIFIPATRSFMSDFDNMRLDSYSQFELLPKEKISLSDKTLDIFSQVYRTFIKHFDSLRHPLMRGRITKIEGNTLKFSNNGQELDSSEISSGQRALFPILMILQEVKKTGKPHLIIIEEPEAHIFPKDQKLILNEIIKFANKTQSKILLTTHSPYILMAMNNLIEANTSQYKKLKSKFIDYEATNVQCLANGKNKDILNYKNKLISLKYIQKIDNDLIDEFHKILHANR